MSGGRLGAGGFEDGRRMGDDYGKIGQEQAESAGGWESELGQGSSVGVGGERVRGGVWA